MLINLENPTSKPVTGVALLQLGFRPFFLLAGVSAALLLLFWGFVFQTGSGHMAYTPVSWHGHEMIFGYVAAVVAGFLLTAAKNWTGKQTLKGPALLLLALLWLAGRIGSLMAGSVPLWLISLIDLSFIPALALAVAVPVVQTKNYRNLVFIGILLVYSTANGLFHLGANGRLEAGETTGIFIGLYSLLLLISVMGGRVIPFFIERGLRNGFKASTRKTIEIFAQLLLVVIALMQIGGVEGRLPATVALAAAAMHAIRLAGWYHKGIWRVPLLWVLVTAYGWIVIGLFLMAPAMLGLLNPMLAIHAMTAGGIGLVTTGMMVRVSMGHSGRQLHAPNSLVLAFILLNLAAITRVFVPMLLPDYYADTVFISAMLWATAFLIFAVRMAPIYWLPRVDGRPG